jgi:hypothetical protein
MSIECTSIAEPNSTIVTGEDQRRYEREREELRFIQFEGENLRERFFVRIDAGDSDSRGSSFTFIGE